MGAPTRGGGGAPTSDFAKLSQEFGPGGAFPRAPIKPATGNPTCIFNFLEKNETNPKSWREVNISKRKNIFIVTLLSEKDGRMRPRDHCHKFSRSACHKNTNNKCLVLTLPHII